MKQKTTDDLRNALKKHFQKMKTDEAYRLECDKERDALFWSCDTNANKMLDLDEYLVFCKKQGENLSKRIGTTFVNVAEETMKKTWEMNRHEGKEGITLDDFHKKQEIDRKLMLWKTEEDKIAENK